MQQNRNIVSICFFVVFLKAKMNKFSELKHFLTMLFCPPVVNRRLTMDYFSLIGKFPKSSECLDATYYN